MGLRLSFWLVLVGAFAAGTGSTSAQPAYEYLRIVAPSAPGGGWDQTARVMQQVLQRGGQARTVSVENIPGAAGLIGLARFVGSERGNGDTVMLSGLVMLGASVAQRSALTLHDVTPIARLTGDYEVLVVPAASPFRTLGDFLRAFKARPEAIPWGGGSAGGSDQILAGLIADAVGIAPRRINYIAFAGGGESLSAILGGEVSVGVSTYAEFAPQLEAATIRALAISSAERLPGLSVPTLREQGVNVEFENWRSVFAPPGITVGDRRRLEATIAAMVQSAPWHEALERYRWVDRHLAGDAFVRFVDAEEARVRAIVRALGTEGSGAESGGPQASAAGPYPLIVIFGLVLSALGLAVGRLRARSSPHEDRPRPNWNAVALVTLGIALDLAMAESAGFVLASAVMFWFVARAFDRSHPIRDAISAACVSAGAYLLFARVLDLQLPAGVLAGWL